MPTPALPTATAVPIQRARPGRLESSEGGLALDYPTNWRLDESATELGTLALLINPNETAYAVVYQSLRPTDRDLVAASESVHDQVYGWFDDVEWLGDQPWPLNDGRPAWASEYVAAINGVPIYILMVTAVEGSRLVTLMTYCATVIYEREYETLETIAKSMRLSPQRAGGVSRDEALVLVDQDSDAAQEHDPALGGGYAGLFSSLVQFTPAQTLAPDLAEGWSISADGTVYTFALQPNARFHDGRRLTAADVIYSWERAIRMSGGSSSAVDALIDIVGAEAYLAGESETISGLHALNERTLEVSLREPRPAFLQQLTTSPTMIVDQADVESGPEWYLTPNGSGPYRLSRRVAGEYALLERFDRFYGPQPAIRYIVYRLYGAGAFGLYEFDYVDIARLGAADADRAADPGDPVAGELFAAPGLCTSFVAIDTSRPPFDDPQVRRAFATAIDTERYRSLALGEEAITARGLYPPALPGYNAEFSAVIANSTTAQQLLADSAYGGPANLPAITLTAQGYGGELGPEVGALVRLWREVLGVTIRVVQITPGQDQSRVPADGGRLALRTWCAGYPDPAAMVDPLFRNESPLRSGYASPELDELLAQARREDDHSRRLALYRTIEQNVIADAGIIVLSHPLQRVLVKPRVLGYPQSALPLPIERYLSLESNTP
ncbi:MAG: hypothetical protein HC822_03965 [Oscillochloris sp.]|nr:hypothetical protein [Oscillochloris sp.]